ncbi:MAG TPA: hypothetical protein VD838_01435 [Anaeromyxobacteraceae bacterium]|nr:hypothetical protein [Anaeromyxobacteraceae bacterium]
MICATFDPRAADLVPQVMIRRAWWTCDVSADGSTYVPYPPGTDLSGCCRGELDRALSAAEFGQGVEHGYCRQIHPDDLAAEEALIARMAATVPPPYGPGLGTRVLVADNDGTPLIWTGA